MTRDEVQAVAAEMMAKAAEHDEDAARPERTALDSALLTGRGDGLRIAAVMLEEAKANAEGKATEDSDDAAYWEHQIRSFDSVMKSFVAAISA